jgi:hypothetical protein
MRTSMTSVKDDAATQDAATSLLAASFALLAAVAWLVALSGVSVALTCYGAMLVSAHLLQRSRAQIDRRQRVLALLGVALTWFVALAYLSLSLPSNFGAAIL